MSASSKRPPNVLLLITDQQRYPRHWPDEPGWLRELMPNDAELARTGLTFHNAYCNTAMCSPSRSTLFTGLYPAHHGVPLTLTQGDLRPDPAHRAAVFQTVAEIMRRPGAPRRRLGRQFLRGLLGIGLNGGGEPQLRPTCRRCCAPPATRSPTRASGTSPIRSATPTARADCSAAGATATSSCSSRPTASPAGRRPTPARTPKPPTSAAATPASARLGRGVHAPDRALARPARPP